MEYPSASMRRCNASISASSRRQVIRPVSRWRSFFRRLALVPPGANFSYSAFMASGRMLTPYSSPFSHLLCLVLSYLG